MEIEWKIDMSCAKNSQSENASFGQGSGKNWPVVVIFVVREKSDLAGLLHYLRLLSFFGTEIDSFTGYSVIPQILFKKVSFFFNPHTYPSIETPVLCPIQN